MKHLLLAVFIGVSSVSAATDTLSEPLEVPATDEVLVRFEEGSSLLKKDQYEASIAIFQSLVQDTQVQQRARIYYPMLFSLATNYVCMFIRELGTVDQQRGSINKAIEYFE